MAWLKSHWFVLRAFNICTRQRTGPSSFICMASFPRLPHLVHNRSSTTLVDTGRRHHGIFHSWELVWEPLSHIVGEHLRVFDREIGGNDLLY